MKKEKFDIGIVGLGVMGRNFALNIADHGFSVAGLDTNADKVHAFNDKGEGESLQATTTAKEFVASLKKPRAAMILVPAGNAVDSVISELQPLLSEGDLIIDGGNSQFTDTERRHASLKKAGIHFLGVGISGGEEGARHGPSIMPGGSKKAYERVKPIFEAASAHVKGEPCVQWLGRSSAGHYVKMVHNGIEYGLMELIVECYDLMRRGLGMENHEIQQEFSKWSESNLSSYLIEITADIFSQSDNKGEGSLIDVILDSARQKGTGKWSSQDAMELKVPVPTIDLAVVMRDMSSYKDERVDAAEILKGPESTFAGDKQSFLQDLYDAMHTAMIITYAQGLTLLTVASEAYDYGLNLANIAKIWRGGCIIRAEMLEQIRSAYRQNGNLKNMMIDDYFASILAQKDDALRNVIQMAASNGLPAAGMMGSLSYYDSYRSARLPANLIQAQRDYFGSHTYERIDTEGTFHTEWNSLFR